MSFPILQSSRIFNPVDDIPGIFAWYHANNVYGNNTNPTTGTAIATWADLTPNGYDFTQGAGAAQPTFTTNLQNDHPGIVFNMASDLVGPNSFLLNLSTTYTIYIVMKSDTAVNLQEIPLVAVADDLSNRFIFLVPNDGNTSVYMDFGDLFAGSRLVVSEADIYSSPYAHCFEIDPPNMTNYRNNIQKGTNATALSFTPGAKIPHMGWELSPNYTCYEMICCNSAHDSTTREQIFSYLNNYWELY